MGLAEKRAIAGLAEKANVEWKNRIQDATGFPIELEVKWDTLAEEGYAESYSQWADIFINPFETALRSICQDDLGKNAFKAKFKKVVFQNTTGTSSPENALTFEGSTIILDHGFCNVDYKDDRIKAWIDGLEKVL